MLDSYYSVANSEIVFEEFNGDLVVLDLGTGRYFGFNAVGAATWLALMDGACARDIASAGLDEAQLSVFLNTILREGIAIQAEGSRSSLPVKYAELLQSSDEAPGIEAFDDLSDLMMSDPIHGVDAEMGWPHTPKGK
ncbi:MAG: hypothetical protein RIQ75_1002 [Pseudomonadota bacterium]|jgi:hypothetical protein